MIDISFVAPKQISKTGCECRAQRCHQAATFGADASWNSDRRRVFKEAMKAGRFSWDHAAGQSLPWACRLSWFLFTLFGFFSITVIAAGLDKSALLGVWEGITPYGNELVHIEIGNDKDSFLAFVPNLSGSDFKNFVRGPECVYILESTSIEGRKVTMHFHPSSPAFPNEIIIAGEYHEGDVTGGLIAGTMTRYHTRDGSGNPATQDIVLRKGAWTRNFDFLSKFAEEAIRQARRR